MSTRRAVRTGFLGQNLRRLLAGLRYGAALLGGGYPVLCPAFAPSGRRAQRREESWVPSALAAGVASLRRAVFGSSQRRSRAPKSLYLEALEQRQLMSAFQITGNATVFEGSTCAITFNHSDSSLDPASQVTLAWGDGATSTGRLDAGMTHVYADGNATGSPYTLTVTSAIEGNGTHITDLPSLALTVNNVAPTLNVSISAPIPGGNLGQYVLTRTDPGADTVSNVAVDWGDGQTSGASALVSVLNLTHIYSNSGTYTVATTVTDEDGTYGAPAASITVNGDNWSLSSAQTAQDHTAPTLTGLTVSYASDSAIYLYWNTAQDNVGVDRIQLLRDGHPIADLSGTTTYYTDNQVRPDTSYVYTAVAYDLAGNTSTPATANAQSGSDTSTPNAPTGLYVTTATVADGNNVNAQVVLKWSPAIDNYNGGGVVKYRVYRSDVSGCTEVTDTTYTDTNLPTSWTASNMYASLYYSVGSVDAHGNESYGRAYLTVAPSNLASSGKEIESNQYIPQDYQDYFYGTTVNGQPTGLTPQLRELAARSGSTTVPAAQGWLDVGSPYTAINSSDIIIANGQYGNLPTIPNAYYHDANNNNRYDPGEYAWYYSYYGTYKVNYSVPLWNMNIPSNLDGMSAKYGIFFLPSDSNWGTYHDGDELYADVTQVHGIPNGYAYYDADGDGIWDFGSQPETIWQNTSGDGVYHAGTDAIIYQGYYSPQDGQIGKTNGLFYQEVSGKTMVWADQTNFHQDFSAFYTGVESMAKSFAPANDLTSPFSGGSLIASVAANHTASGSGTISIASNQYTLTGDGNTRFKSELAVGDWISISGGWYQVSNVTDDHTLTLDLAQSFDWLDVTNVSYTIVNWTRISDVPDSATGLALNYERGKPTATGPVFHEQFDELHAALDLLTVENGTVSTPSFQQAYYDQPGWTYNSARFNNATYLADMGSAYKMAGVYSTAKAALGLSNYDFLVALAANDFNAGMGVSYFWFSDLRYMYSTLDSYVYAWDYQDNTVYRDTYGYPEHLSQLSPVNWESVPYSNIPYNYDKQITAAQWSQIGSVAQSFIDNGLWVSNGSGGFYQISFTLGSAPTSTLAPLSTALGDAPTLTLSPTVEMDARNIVPDSNLDGIVNVPVDLTTFGNDSGIITVDPQRGMGQVYIPISIDTTQSLPINGYLMQGAFGAAAGDLPLSNTQWTYTDIAQQGLSWSYSLDEHVTLNLYINTPQNHVARFTVYRPGGNAVTFDFAWNETTKSFSEWGLPVGTRDGSRTYVLHATSSGNSESGVFHDAYLENGTLIANFELRFADGTVHTFGNYSGSLISRLSQVRTADGTTQYVSWQLNPSYNTPLTTSSSRYDVSLGYQTGRLATVTYRAKLVSGATDSITTTLNYLSTGSGFSLITGLSKHAYMNEPGSGRSVVDSDVPEFSYTVTGGTTGEFTNTLTITNNGTHNTITRTASITSGELHATLASASDGVGSSNDYVFNASGMMTNFTHHLGNTSDTTTYIYAEGSGRYASNGAAPWGKVSEILYADGSWEGYTYNAATGWMAAYITPFKGTTAPNAANLADYVTDSTGINLETYSYDAQIAGGGDPADVNALAERPREICAPHRNLVT